MQCACGCACLSACIPWCGLFITAPPAVARRTHLCNGPAPPCADPDLVATVFAPTDDAFVAALEALNVTAAEILADTVSQKWMLYGLGSSRHSAQRWCSPALQSQGVPGV